MEILVPAAAAAILVLPVILLLYFLKVRGPEVPVSSFVLWARHLADHQANAPWKRLHLSWLLVAQLLVAGALVFALMRPSFEGASGVAMTTVVLIDGSPSMMATDVAPSRFEAAVSRSRRLAGQLGSEGQMAVAVLGDHAKLLTPATHDVDAIRAALDRARPAGEAANLEEGISLANAILAGRPEGSVLFLSDGHAKTSTSPPRLAARFSYESIGDTGENAAVETVGRTPEGDIFLRVANFGTVAKELKVQMRADGDLVDVLPVRVEPNSSVEPIWRRLPPGAGVIEARLSPGDDFNLDDAAWLVTEPPATRRVLMVTPGNGFLFRALELRPDLDVTVMDPASYEPVPSDLYVFDRFVPPGPLPEPAFVIAPPEGTGPVTAGPSIDPGGLLPSNPREPVLQYASLRDVHVQTAAAVTPPVGWRTVIDATKGPLLLVRQADSRVAQLNFDIHRSDLPIRAAFPILVQNLVSQLMPGSFENQVLPLGQPVRLAGSPDVESMEVTTPDGNDLRLRPPFPATIDETLQPGVYSVREKRPTAIITTRFIVQLQDPVQSLIAPGEKPLVQAIARTPGRASKGTLEIWPWLAGLAFAGLIVESVLFLRG